MFIVLLTKDVAVTRMMRFKNCAVLVVYGLFLVACESGSQALPVADVSSAHESTGDGTNNPKGCRAVDETRLSDDVLTEQCLEDLLSFGSGHALLICHDAIDAWKREVSLSSAHGQRMVLDALDQPHQRPGAVDVLVGHSARAEGQDPTVWAVVPNEAFPRNYLVDIYYLSNVDVLGELVDVKGLMTDRDTRLAYWRAFDRKAETGGGQIACREAQDVEGSLPWALRRLEAAFHEHC